MARRTVDGRDPLHCHDGRSREPPPSHGQPYDLLHWGYGTGSINVGGTTGTVSLTASGCTSSGTACTTPGQASGVIVTSPNLVTHNILLESGPPTLPGIKVTGVGATTQLAHYTCGFGLVTVNITGTLVGAVEQACGIKGKVFSGVLEAPGGVQKWTQETTTGTKQT